MIVMITTIVGSSFLKSFAKWIGMDEEETEEDPINYQRMLDERISRNDSISNYYNIGLGYESDQQQQESGDESNLSTTKKIEKFENQFIKPLFQKKNKLSYEMQSKK